MFTKGTPSGAAAVMSDGTAGLGAAGDVAAGFPASTVFGSPAAPQRELPHMRALCGEGDRGIFRNPPRNPCSEGALLMSRISH